MTAIRYVPFAGRLLIGLPFAMSGLSKLGAIGPTTEAIRMVGLPSRPWLLPFASRSSWAAVFCSLPDSRLARPLRCLRCSRWSPRWHSIATLRTRTK